MNRSGNSGGPRWVRGGERIEARRGSGNSHACLGHRLGHKIGNGGKTVDGGVEYQPRGVGAVFALFANRGWKASYQGCFALDPVLGGRLGEALFPRLG